MASDQRWDVLLKRTSTDNASSQGQSRTVGILVVKSPSTPHVHDVILEKMLFDLQVLDNAVNISMTSHMPFEIDGR